MAKNYQKLGTKKKQALRRGIKRRRWRARASKLSACHHGEKQGREIASNLSWYLKVRK